MCRRKTMNYRSKYPVFSGLWKLELQLSMKTDLSCINLPGIWVLPKPKGASSALFVDDSCSPNEACVYISRGQCPSVNFSGWVSAFFCVKYHHLMWIHRDKYLFQLLSMNYGFKCILSVIPTVLLHLTHSRSISSLLPWILYCVSLASEHLKVLICCHKTLVKKLGKVAVPILQTTGRSREVENTTTLCRNTPSMSVLERVLHPG